MIMLYIKIALLNFVKINDSIRQKKCVYIKLINIFNNNLYYNQKKYIYFLMDDLENKIYIFF